MPQTQADWHPVNSSFLVRVRLVLGSWLDIEFKGGFIARYFDLPDPEAMFESLLNAPSKGKWWHANLKTWQNWSKI